MTRRERWRAGTQLSLSLPRPHATPCATLPAVDGAHPHPHLTHARRPVLPPTRPRAPPPQVFLSAEQKAAQEAELAAVAALPLPPDDDDDL